MMRSASALVVAVLLLAAPSGAGGSRLFDAIRNDDLAAVQQLLAGGGDVHARDDTGATPLMYAALYGGSAAVVKVLVDKGAEVNAANSNGSTALMWAAGNTAKVRLLLEHGAAVDLRTKDGTTALVAAARRGNTDAMRLLLSRGANPGASAEETANLLRVDYALDTVIEYSREDRVMRRLLEEAGVVLKTPAQFRAPLVPSLGNAKTIEKLLDRGADPKGEFGLATLTVSTLAIAAFDGRVDAMRVLVDRGAETNFTGTRGLTPLMMAAAGHRPSPAAVRLLLAKGADIRARDDLGRTALDWALTQGETPVALLLRQAGATATPLPAPPSPVAKPRIAREAVERAVARLQPIGPTFNRRTKCISCHNESLPAVAVKLASAHGISVDRDLAAHPTQATLVMWEPARESLLLGRHAIGGFLENVGYALFAFAEEGVAPNRVTDAVVSSLATYQYPDGAWKALDIRPPLGDAAPLPYTALAIRALATYSPPGQRDEASARIAKAMQFVRKTMAGDTQDEAFKVLALVWSGAQAPEISRQTDRLRALQRPDGGWRQLPTMDADAYATGQALYALHAAGLAATSTAYQKGADYLLRTQLEDGSWFVRSRGFAFQPYFDAGFPHGTNQFISAAATSWAAIALAYTL